MQDEIYFDTWLSINFGKKSKSKFASYMGERECTISHWKNNGIPMTYDRWLKIIDLDPLVQYWKFFKKGTNSNVCIGDK